MSPPPPSGCGRLWPFFKQEYLRLMRGRLALLVWALIAYTIAILPFLMARPPPEILGFIEAWLGAQAAQSKLLLFIWVDTAMNKLAVILGPVLAGGIIVEERSRGTLDLLAAKPIRAEDYYTIKIAAAATALTTFYVAACFGAAVMFSWRVQGFAIADLAALSIVHLFAALFTVTFSGVMATVFARRLTGMLVSIAVLGTLVGLAFLGFYYPDYYAVSHLNPFFDGILLIGSLDHFGAGDVLFPILLLVGFNLAFWIIGRRRAGHLLRGGMSTPADAAMRPFAALLRMDLRRALGRRHAVALISIAVMGIILAFWLPTFPASIHRFFERIFQLEGWPAIVVANDLAGLFFFIYWVGVFDVLTIYVVPLEERYLDLYLSKPLTRRQYMLARLIPIMLIALGLGIISALVHWVALVAAGLDYPWLVYLGASAAVLAWTIFLIAIVNLAVLLARETYAALLIAFVPLALSVLPGSIYMYRPDVFEGAPILRNVIVFPTSLLWHSDFTARWGVALGVVLLGLAIALIAMAGRLIEGRDVA